MWYLTPACVCSLWAPRPHMAWHSPIASTHALNILFIIPSTTQKRDSCGRVLEGATTGKCVCFIFDITTVLAKAGVIHSVCDHQVCHWSLPASGPVYPGLQWRWHWLLGSDGKAVLFPRSRLQVGRA